MGLEGVKRHGMKACKRNIRQVRNFLNTSDPNSDNE